MRSPETSPYDAALVTPPSRRFAEQLFARFPDLRHHARMGRAKPEEPWRLVVPVPPPSGDACLELVVWVDEVEEPSVAFGSWHTHESCWAAGDGSGESEDTILDLVAAIMSDRVVLCDDVGREAADHATIVDLSQPDALLEELTSPYGSGRVHLRSWSGQVDRVVGLEDVTGDCG